MPIDDELRELIHELVIEETEKQIAAYEQRLAEQKAQAEMTPAERVKAGYERAS